jgi:energy-coupling factor transport system substrate-specific component
VRAAKDGSTVVACTGGVSVIEDDRVKAVYGRDDGIANVEILTVEVAPNGDIIAGTDGGGIYVIDGKGTVRHVGTEEGLSSQIVMRVKHDPTYGLFWLVTSNSISYMSEDYAVTTVSDFPYSNNFDLYENSQGDMWVLSSDGIYVVSTEELVSNGELHCAHYGMSNGMPCTATSNSYSELTDEGDLYMAGNKGVIKLNVELPLEDVTVLKKGVPFVEADGVTLYPD